MKRKLHLCRGDIKYWISEFPNKIVYNYKTKKFTCDVIKKAAVYQNSIILELHLHKDVNSYGRLGIQYEPQLKDTLEVIVHYVDENSISYQSELIKYDKFMYMYHGLPQDCLKFVEKSIKQHLDIYGFSGGKITVSFAANSEVKSSPLFFGIMTSILMKILVANEWENVESELEMDAIIEKYFLESSLFRANI